MEGVYEQEDVIPKPKASAATGGGKKKMVLHAVDELGAKLHAAMIQPEEQQQANADDLDADDAGLASADGASSAAQIQDRASQRMRKSTLYEESISTHDLSKRVHPGPIYCMQVFNNASSSTGSSKHQTKSSPPGFIATGGRDGMVRLFHMDEKHKQPFAELEGHTNAVMCLAVFRPSDADDESGRSSSFSSLSSTASAVVISGGRDKSVRVWVVATKSCFQVLRGHEETVWCVQCLQPQGLEPVIVSGDLQGNILIWSLLRGDLLRTIVAIPRDVKEHGVMCLQIYCPPFERGSNGFPSPLIISGGEDQLINVWTIETGELLKVFLGHSDVVMCLAVCDNFVGEVEEGADVDAERDTLIVSGSKDGTVRIWSMATTEMLRIFRSHTSTVFSVCAQPLQYFDSPAHSNEKKDGSWVNLMTSLWTTQMQRDSSGGKVSPDSLDINEVGVGVGNRPSSSQRGAGGLSLHEQAAKSPMHSRGESLSSAGDSSVGSRRWVVNLLITSAGKDGHIYIWNLATGRSTRTLQHHASGVTGVATVLDSEGDTVIISASTDGTLAKLTLTSALKTAAIQAYRNDVTGITVPIHILVNVPEEFQPWAHVYILIRREKMTVDQFFALENFTLFSEAIKDGRCDFVETFLPLSPSGLVYLCQGASTALTRDRRASSKPHALLSRILTTDLTSLGKDLKELQHGLNDGVKALRTGLHDLQESVFRSGKEEEDDLAAFQGSSILRQAIAKGDVRIILCILDNWRTLLNAPPHDWMEQCKGAFTRLDKADLLALAKKFPLIFQNFITSLRLQRAHTFIVRGCNAKIAADKAFLKKGTNGNLRFDVELWKSRDSQSKETMEGKYLPLAYAADLIMLKAYTDVCYSLDSVAIFQSEVGSAAIKFAWSSYGLKQHMRRFAGYVVFIFALIGFLLTDTSADTAMANKTSKHLTIAFSAVLLSFVSLQMLGHCRQCHYEKRSLFEHFRDFWPALELLGAVFIGYSTILRLLQKSDASSDNVSRFLLSINLLIQMLTTLSFFRAFENTGPLVSMVIRIVYEIRYYLGLLAVVLFGFSLSFWCLCSQDYSAPDVITYLNINPQPKWYSDPIAGNDDPQGTYAFSTLQGAYLESFIYLTGQFSVVPFVACGYDESHQTINFAQRGFAIFLSAIFAVLVQILMVNVLIALMTESYGRIRERGLAQAKLMQAQLICESAGALSSTIVAAKKLGKILQPKIIHLLMRSGTYSSGADESSAGGEDLAVMSEQVTQHTRLRADRIEVLLRSTAVEVDDQVSEQEKVLFEMRRKLDILLLKTKRVLNH